MRKLTTFLLLFIASISRGFSQEVRGVAILIKTGYSHTADIGSIFETHIIKDAVHFKNHFINVGGELHYRRNSSILILDASVGAQGEQRAGYTVMEPFSGFALLKYGQVVHETKKMVIYPAIGAGSSFFFLTSYDKVGNFSSNQHNISWVHPGAEVSMHMDIIPRSVSRDHSIISGGIIGFRAAIHFTSIYNNPKPAANAYRHVLHTRNFIGYSFSIAAGLGDYKRD